MGSRPGARRGSPQTGSRRIRAALSEFRAALQSIYGQDAPSIIAYGSYARNQMTPSSDIDLLLLYPADIRSGQEIARVSPVLADMNLRYSVLISVLPVSQVDYDKAVGAFWQNVRREGVVL